MSEWQPIETAPKDGQPVLAHKAGAWAHPIVLCWLDGPRAQPAGWKLYTGSAHIQWHPTHWMPLPEPPK